MRKKLVEAIEEAKRRGAAGRALHEIARLEEADYFQFHHFDKREVNAELESYATVSKWLDRLDEQGCRLLEKKKELLVDYFQETQQWLNQLSLTFNGPYVAMFLQILIAWNTAFSEDPYDRMTALQIINDTGWGAEYGLAGLDK